MVTKKTRLMSAFAAVLMLVSLFAGFVLPASAEETFLSKEYLDATYPNAPVEWPESGLVPYKYAAENADNTAWAITDEADWIAAVATSNEALTGVDFKGHDFWFTADLDFEGTPIDPMSAGAYAAGRGFLGDIFGQGHKIDGLNINVDSTGSAQCVALIGVSAAHTTAGNANDVLHVVRDLSIASGTIQGTFDANEGSVGAFLGKGLSIVFINCWNNASVTANGASGTKAPIAAFGRLDATTPQYNALINCINTGDLTASGYNAARIMGLAQWVKGTTYVYNCVNTGKLTGGTISGLIQGSNATNYGLLDMANSYTTEGAGGVYAGGTVTTTGELVEMSAGGLAWTLNKGYTAAPAAVGYASSTAYFTTAAEGEALEIRPGTADNRTVKVEFIFGGELYSEAYVNLNEAVDVAPLCNIEDATYTSANATVADGKLTVTSAPADTLTVTIDVTTTAKVVADTTPLTEWITAFVESGKNADYYSVDGKESGESLTAAIERVEANIGDEVYVYASEVEEEVANLASYKMWKVLDISEYETYTNEAAGYYVDTKDEMDFIAENMTTFSDDQTIYITDDIDMEGSKEALNARLGSLKASIVGVATGDGSYPEISNLYVADGWLGDATMAKLANLTFKNCHNTFHSSDTYGSFLIGLVTKDLVVENITLDGCYGDNTDVDGGAAYAMMFGRVKDGINLTLNNITVKNCTLDRKDGTMTNYHISAFVLGKLGSTAASTATLTATNIYLIDNTVTGSRAGSGRGLVVGEWIGTGSLTNVGVFNTTITDDAGAPLDTAGVRGVLYGSSTLADNTAITATNVVAANNGTIATLGYGTAAQTMTACYADTTEIVTAEGAVVTSCGVVTTEEAASGKVAWTANAGGAAQKWTMDGTTPAFGTEENMTVRVALELMGSEIEYLYVNLNEEAALTHTVAVDPTFTLKEAVDYATITDGKITVTGAPANAELTVYVTVTTDGLVFALLDEKIAEIGENAAYYVNAAGDAVLTDVLAAIKEKRAAGYEGLIQDDVDADLELLNSYTLYKDPDFTAIEMIIGDLEKYIVDGTNLMTQYFEKGEELTEALEKAKLALTLKKGSYTDGLDAKPVIDAINAAATLYSGASDKTLKTTIAFKDYAPFAADGFKEFGITDEADWRLLVDNATTNGFTTGLTFKLTNDIDMLADGDDSTVHPFGYVNDIYFNGTLDGQGYVFKNLKIEETPDGHDRPIGLIAAIGATGTVKNLGIESGSIICNWGVPNLGGLTNGMGVGAIAGVASSGSKIINCWNGATVSYVLTELRTDLVPEDTSGLTGDPAPDQIEDDTSAGGIAGRGTRGSLIDGCYNIGTINGLLHASGINDWTQSMSSGNVGLVYNSFNAGTINATSKYLVRTSGSDAAAAQLNNYSIGTANTASNTHNTADNSYLFVEEYTSGEMAWKLNKNAFDGGNGTTYYTVVDGKTVFGTADDQIRRITFTDGTVTYYAYVTNGTAVSYGAYAEIANADLVVNVEAGALAHEQHDLKYTDNCRNDYHIAYCDGELEIAGFTAYCDYAEYVACSNLKKEVVAESVDADTHAHKYVEICLDCNQELAEVDCVADFTEAVTGDMTCTQDGEKTHTCQTCGYFYTELIPAEGHDLTYTPNNDQTHNVTCGKGDLNETNVPCTPDENAWVEVGAPSVDATGLKKTVCTLCGGEVTEVIPKTAVLTVAPELNAEETEAIVRVNLKNNPGVSTLKLLVTYDASAMTLTGTTAGNYAGVVVGAPAGEGTGIVTKEIAISAEADLTGDDLLVSLNFEIANDGAGNVTASNKDYAVIVAAAEAKNAAAAEVTFGAAETTITITKGTAYTKGDMNGDTVVDIADAVLLLRYNATKPDGATEAVVAGYTITDAMADLIEDGDAELGEANINDVVYLMQYINGWYPVL